jgi:hypothetical protein
MVLHSIYLPVPANASPAPTRVAKVLEELILEFGATPPADALMVTTTSSRTELTTAAIILEVEGKREEVKPWRHHVVVGVLWDFRYAEGRNHVQGE